MLLAGLILRHACVLLFYLCFCILLYSSSGVSGPAVAIISPAIVLATTPVAVLTVVAAIALVCCVFASALARLPLAPAPAPV